MKRAALALLSSIAVICLAGCIYEAPLVAKHTIPIDPALVGLWEAMPKEPAEPEKDDGRRSKILDDPLAGARLLIIKFSDTEYVIAPGDQDGIYYRAYAIELGGKRCMQLEVIGTNEGPPDWEGKNPEPFLVCSYEMKDGNLLVRFLNEEIVGDDLKTTEALQEAFLKNKDNAELFGEPSVYRRVKAD
jgi:hypothetical protein